MLASDAQTIVAYWLGESAKSPAQALAREALWYEGGPDIDVDIRTRFGRHVTQALAGSLASWAHSAGGSLALVILLDQFTRNLYRATPRAYTGDPLARRIAIRAVDSGQHGTLSVPGQIFLFHPFQHSEDLSDQRRGIALIESLEQRAPGRWRAYIRRQRTEFEHHRDLIARFGRFPHRNRVLGRDNTAEEQAFLADHPEAYGQELSD